jgi:hypothetical protein
MEDAYLAATFAATLKRSPRRIVGPTNSYKEIVSDTRSPRYRAPAAPSPRLHVHDPEALRAFALHQPAFSSDHYGPKVRVFYILVMGV